MHSFVTSKNVKWCHLIWATLYFPHFFFLLPSSFPVSRVIYISVLPGFVLSLSHIYTISSPPLWPIKDVQSIITISF